MNKNELKACMIINHDNMEILSNYLNITNASLSYKINGKRDFLRKEIKAIKDRYNLTAEQVDSIFFN